jgi:histidine triad (HIT) family protein
MSTIFTKIINGEIPCAKLREDSSYFAFLDVRPINPGHALVIPKLEVEYIFDLEDDLLGGLMVFAKPVARAIQHEVECRRIGVMVVGIDVPHVHVHLVPFTEMGELTFERARPADPGRLESLAERIRSHL